MKSFRISLLIVIFIGIFNLLGLYAQSQLPATARSTITLPDRRLTQEERNEWIAEYIAFGGPTTVELETVRLINIERANLNLSRVEIDNTLMMAARFFAQQAHDLRGLYSGSHNFGPYATDQNARHGASANVAAAFGARLRWNAGNWFSSGSMTAASLVTGWMNSEGHRRYIVSPEHRFIGVGQFPGGISYMYLSNQSSQVVYEDINYTGTWRIQLGNGRLVDIREQNTNNGVAVIQQNRNGGRSQLWIFEQHNDRTYTITNAQSNRVMDVQDSRITQNGARVQQWQNNNTPNQRWRIFTDGDFVIFQNAASGKLLDMSRSNYDNPGHQFHQWDNNGGENQKFRLEAVR